MNQDLMLQPEDSLQKISPKEPEVSFTAPAAWGEGTPTAPIVVGTAGQKNFSENPPALSPVAYSWLTPPPPPSQPSQGQVSPPESLSAKESLLSQEQTPHQAINLPKTFLLALVLILSGILLGILASKFFPAFTILETPTQPVTTPTPDSSLRDTQDAGRGNLTPLITIAPTIIPTPTATSAALLSLKWNMLTMKSPNSLFESYRLHYPTTWAVKSQKITKEIIGKNSGSSSLILTKGTTTFTIFQSEGDAAGCLYPSDADKDGMYQRYESYREIIKGNLSWRWGRIISAEPDKNIYYVCEQNKSNKDFFASTTMGYISINGSEIDEQTQDEVSYILQKLEIIKNTPTTATYTCPSNGWVDCQPILDEAKKKACSPEAMTWYEQNCSNFQGGAL